MMSSPSYSVMFLSPTVTASDLRLQARAAAGRAGHGRHVALDLAADVVGVGLAVAALHVGDDALVRRVPAVRVAAATSGT